MQLGTGGGEPGGLGVPQKGPQASAGPASPMTVPALMASATTTQQGYKCVWPEGAPRSGPAQKQKPA